MTRLNEWCTRIAWPGGRFPVYTLERVEEHLKALRNIDVIRSCTFTSPLLGAYCLGNASHFPLERDDEQALFRGALQRIREPEVMQLIDSGGQASVYSFIEDGLHFAYRKVELNSAEERACFNERVDTLSALKHRIRGHEGSQYIYDLDRIGLSMTGEAGVEIYRWIDGGSLEQKREKLPARAVSEIGVRIARGLEAIHSHGILHRDIRPRNIILAEDTLVPVLIDFGLARLTTSEMTTILLDEMVAPEVRHRPPKWDKPADIFALGKTLFALLTPTEFGASPSLITTLRSCCADDPEERPSATEMVALLRQAEAVFNIDLTVDRTWRSLAKLAPAKSVLRQVMDKFRPHIKGFSMGLFQNSFECCAEIALFLDQVVEAHGHGKWKLGTLKNERDYSGVDLRGPDLDFVHALRLERSHWMAAAKQQKILQKYEAESDSHMRALMLGAATKLGDALSINGLRPVVEALLDISIGRTD
jgi:hypothetical protein